MAARSKHAKWQRVWLTLLVVSSVWFALHAYRFAFMGFDEAYKHLHSSMLERSLPFLVHVAIAPIALMLGPLQFLPRLRSRHPKTHRTCGAIYCAAVFIAAISGLPVALGATDRPSAALAYSVGMVLWFAFTVYGFALIRQRRYQDHRDMMLRSFALTFTAVTFRAQMWLVFRLTDMSYADASLVIAWTAWIPNLLIVEWWIWRKNRDRMALPLKDAANAWARNTSRAR